MLYFFRNGQSRLTSETRLNPSGEGYQLVVTTDGVEQTESFSSLSALLSREHELLQAWRAVGWQEAAAGPRPADNADQNDLDWLSRH